MRLVSPSYLGYAVWFMYKCGLIKTDRASMVWPYIESTCILGAILIIAPVFLSVRAQERSCEMYSSVFYLPIHESFPGNDDVINMTQLVTKTVVYRSFPMNRRFFWMSNLFLGGYALLAGLIC